MYILNLNMFNIQNNWYTFNVQFWGFFYTFPYNVLNASPISMRWTMPRLAITSIMAFWSHPKPFIAFFSAIASSFASKFGDANTVGVHYKIRQYPNTKLLLFTTIKYCSLSLYEGYGYYSLLQLVWCKYF